MALKPLGKSFLFSFANDTAGGKFIEKNSGRIILTNQDISQQGQYARWGKVIAVGDEVSDFGIGDLVLIEALQWTTEVKFEGQSFWKSDDSKVIAIGEDESVTYSY
jgi:co-chaperonin GroES (HSP10)